MGTMEVISLDDTADTSVFIIDDKPMAEEELAASRITGVKRKSSGKNKNAKKFKRAEKNDKGPVKKPFRVLGGVVEGMCNLMKKQLPETIVIDDEESVIELSDDDGNDRGLSTSIETAQNDLKNYQILAPRSSTRRRSNRKRVKRIEQKLSVISLDLNDEEDDEYGKGREEISRPLSYVSCPKSVGLTLEQINAPPVKRKLRPVVIDGSNVAFGHGDSRKQFSSKGIQICADYFLKRGHTVKAFVPQFRRRHPATLDTHILDELEEKKIVVYTPSRHVNGKKVVSYDDRMMVEYAAQCGAVVVTRDNFRDIAAENEVFKQVVVERLLMFTWVDDEIIMFPQDPLGRHGPTLDEFLAFPNTEETEKKSNYNEENKEDNKQNNKEVGKKPS